MSLTPEDRDRAQVYRVLAALFVAAPSAELLNSLKPVEGPPEALLVHAWNTLTEAAREPAEAWCDEYNALFVGVGKPEIMLCASYYLAGALHERPLAALRNDLARAGLERTPGTVETEDHVSALFEAMHRLIERNDAAQHTLYTTHVAPWIVQLCDVIDAHPLARLYRAASVFVRAFNEVELQAWSIEETSHTSL